MPGGKTAGVVAAPAWLASGLGAATRPLYARAGLGRKYNMPFLSSSSTSSSSWVLAFEDDHDHEDEDDNVNVRSAIMQIRRALW
jgi:hypothetical protein